MQTDTTDSLESKKMLFFFKFKLDPFFQIKSLSSFRIK